MRVTLESRMLTTYGADKLVRYDDSVVNNLEISQECKDFLMNVGLPRWNGKDMVIGFPFNDLPTLQSIGEDELVPLQATGYDFPQEFRHYRVIGLEALKVFQTQGQVFGKIISFICLDEKKGGRILLVRSTGGDTGRLSS